MFYVCFLCFIECVGWLCLGLMSLMYFMYDVLVVFFLLFNGFVVFDRVMSFIEKSVARLDQSDRLQTLALELGRSHYRYNAPPKYYGVKSHITAFMTEFLKFCCVPNL